MKKALKQTNEHFLTFLEQITFCITCKTLTSNIGKMKA